MNYFTMYDADQFSFIRVPKELMTNTNYKTLSAESKLLYGVLLDRVSLSRKNNWVDERGRVFIIYTRKNIMDIMGSGEKKITKLFNELREKDLIEEKRQGLQKPNLIYVGKFLENPHVLDVETSWPFTLDQDNCNLLQNRHFDGSGPVILTAPEPSKTLLNYTNINNTNISNTDILFSQSNSISSDYETSENNKNEKMERLNEFKLAELYFENNVFAEIREAPTANRNLIDEIKMNVLDMYFAPATIINGNRKCQDIVRAALMRLNSLHIDNVIYKYSNINGQISNNKAYIQTMLYNEALEANLFMTNQVSSDFSNWKD
ncbi:replication initiator protein A [Acetobacterium bakii]|uniref:replication initiator protein A n=1 Tax=Acetobacterium bakii TaxID=52689 RepID=UPI000681697C|nr:replication initiator protein A [Acetobacterium bakii]